MDWTNERYVRVYTRDTATWKLMDWRAHTVLLHMLRKADRAGVIDVGEDGVLGLAAVLEIPLEIVEAGIKQLCTVRKAGQSPTVVWAGNAFVLPNFLEAQEAPQSDPHRKREERARRRDRKMAAAKHLIPDPSQNVTEESQNVTGAADEDEEPPHPPPTQLDLEVDRPGQKRPDPSRNVTPPSEFDRNRHGVSQPVTPIRSEPDPIRAEQSHARARDPRSTDTDTSARFGSPRSRLFGYAWNLAATEHAKLKSEGIDKHARNCWSGIPPADSPESKLLLARVDELLAAGDYEFARERIENRVLVAAAEARHRHRRLEYFTPMRMWNADSFAIAAALSPQQVADGARAGPPRSREQPEPDESDLRRYETLK